MPFPISTGGRATIPVQMGHRLQESITEAASGRSPSRSELTLATSLNDSPNMSEIENESRRIVLGEGRPQGGAPSTVCISALRERVGRELKVHRQRLEVGPGAERVEVGVAVHPGVVAIAPS